MLRITSLIFVVVAASTEDIGFEDWFATELAVANDTTLKVDGKIPAYLDGLFVQSGPARFQMGNMSFGHALDGYSKTIRLHFDASGGATTVKFSTDFLQSRFYQESLKANKIVEGITAAETIPPSRKHYGPMNAMGPNDNNYIKPQKIGDNGLITSDTMYLTVFEDTDDGYSKINYTIAPWSPGTLETKHWEGKGFPETLTGHICMQATMAHGVMDDKGGYVVGMGCAPPANLSFLPSSHIVFRLDPSNLQRREMISQINLPKGRLPSYMHQNGMTDKHYIIVATPIYMDMMQVMVGKGLAEGGLTSPIGDQTLFQILSLKDGSVRTLSAPGFLFGHVINAYDEGDDIVIDLTWYSQEKGGWFPRYLLKNIMDKATRDAWPKGRLMRYRLLANNTVQESLLVPQEPEADTELPVINPKNEGKPYCVFWGVQFSTGGRSFASAALVKRNVCTGENVTRFQEGMYPSEHSFVPRPGATEEDDGVLVGLVFDGQKKTSYVEVVDAKTLETEATMQLGMRVPYAVHATWYDSSSEAYHEAILV